MKTTEKMNGNIGKGGKVYKGLGWATSVELRDKLGMTSDNGTFKVGGLHAAPERSRTDDWLCGVRMIPLFWMLKVFFGKNQYAATDLTLDGARKNVSSFLSCPTTAFN
jgi:hypothetical protein